MPAPLSKRPTPAARRQPSDRRRVFALLIVISLVAAVLVGRLVWYQVARAPLLQREAVAQRLQQIELGAPRGRILDRNGLVLVGNVTRHTLIAIPSQMKSPEQVAEALSRILGRPAAEILSQFATSPYYVVVARQLTDDKTAAVRDLKLTGLNLEPDPIRYYPQGPLAAPLLGVVGNEHHGLEGLELYYDDLLRGQPGILKAEFDPGRKDAISVTVRKESDPVPGDDLVLTIDSVIQKAVEDELDRVQKERQPKRSLVMVYDPATGEILAMAQRPTYDPNRWSDYTVQQRRNWAVTDTVSPGSIFKPLTASTALDSGAMTAEDRIYDNGSYKVPGFTITNWDGGGFGWGGIADAIRTSSNVGFAQIGLKIGTDRFYEYLQRFGFTTGTGIDFPGEASAILPEKGSVRPLDLADMAFGQTLSVTPVQMLAALGAVANDGVRMRPHIVREARSPDGRLVKAMAPVEAGQAVSAAVAGQVRTMMEAVVTRGTGQAAAIPGFDVAGKTGTAQIFDHGKLVDNYLVDFVGMVPSQKPRLMILVMVDQPQKGEALGGIVAAPVFHDLAPGILRQIGVLAPGDILGSVPGPKPVHVPKLVGASVASAFAAARAAGLHLMVRGDGQAITAQEPAPDATLLPGASIAARADPAAGAAAAGSVYVPDLLQASVRQAADALAELGLKVDSSGAGVVSRQEPQPGTVVPRGSAVRLWLGP